MNLLLADWPEETSELVPWLEQQLCSEQLRDLASELQAVFPGDGKPPELNPLLGEHREAVLASGLSKLPKAILRTFLRHPGLLLELQGLILAEGGSYWDRILAKQSQLQAATARNWQRVQWSLEQTASTEPEDSKAVATPAKTPWFQSLWLLTLTTAALLFIAVKFWPQPAPQGIGWGWATTAGLPQAKSSADYLEGLADMAQQWHHKEPDTRQALARRILEFRQGCNVLILSEHPALDPEQQVWLTTKCQAWAGKIDAHLAALESGAPLEEVKQQMDATVDQLSQALRDQAAAARQSA